MLEGISKPFLLKLAKAFITQEKLLEANEIAMREIGNDEMANLFLLRKCIMHDIETAIQIFVEV